MAVNYTSLNVVIDKLLRDPLFNGIQKETIIDYCIDFFSIVGVPDSFDEELYVSEFENYRCLLPSNFVEEIQLFVNGVALIHNSDTLASFYGTGEVNETSNKIDTVATTENFMKSTSKFPRPLDLSYVIRGGIIYLSIEVGTLQMSYRCVKTDEDGYPMIPDNPVFMRALKNYIEVEHLRILWRNNKVADKVFSKAEQDYSFAVGAYETDVQRLSLGKAESLFNSFRTLLMRPNEFQNRFRNLGSKELIKRQ